jgi:hypothetical protein
MKTLFGTNKYVVLLGVVGSAVVIALAQHSASAADQGKRKGKVEIAQDVIVIHPGAKLSTADEKAMDAVLSKYSERLYKLDTIENRKVTSKGSLKDAVLTAAVKAEAPAEAQGGKSHRTHQVICPRPCNENQPPIIPPITALAASQKEKLINELKPILAKYQ